MFGLGMVGCDVDKCLPGKAVFRNLVMEPINALLSKNNKNEVNACLKYHTLWSVMHGLVSIKMMVRTEDTTNELNKLVLDDAIAGFIKNLKE